jgi:hypothetical protein
MMTRLHFAIGITGVFMCQSAGAQTPAAQIKRTSTPPVIDGSGGDAAWANANVYGTTEFNIVSGPDAGLPLEPSADITLEWRALWDDANLYVMAQINDDAIVNSLDAFGGPDLNADYRDDGIEFYIDAQDVDNLEYNPGSTGGPTEPTFQFTSLAGWTPEIADDPNNLASPRFSRDPFELPNTSFTWGINSYNGGQVDNRYPQMMGSATSGPITENSAGGFDWTFEASFPWEALEETPADILARDGIFGFGVAYNDDDDFGDRDAQYMWGTTLADLWHVSASFPDVQLVDAAPSSPGDYNSNGTVEQADLDLVLLNWGQAGVPAGWTNDLPDGNIDQAELDGVLLNWGASNTGDVAAVPEPNTLVLLLAVAGLGLRVARRR